MSTIRIAQGSSGTILTMNASGKISWGPINDGFDDPFANRYAIKCNRMSLKFAAETANAEVNYGHIYRLGEFLWKLKIWKP